jgi:hypothetical protein
MWGMGQFYSSQNSKGRLGTLKVVPEFQRSFWNFKGRPRIAKVVLELEKSSQNSKDRLGTLKVVLEFQGSSWNSKGRPGILRYIEK